MIDIHWYSIVQDMMALSYRLDLILFLLELVDFRKSQVLDISATVLLPNLNPRPKCSGAYWNFMIVHSHRTSCMILFKASSIYNCASCFHLKPLHSPPPSVHLQCVSERIWKHTSTQVNDNRVSAPRSLGSFPSTGVLSVVALIWLDGRDGTTLAHRGWQSWEPLPKKKQKHARSGVGIILTLSKRHPKLASENTASFSNLLRFLSWPNDLKLLSICHSNYARKIRTSLKALGFHTNFDTLATPGSFCQPPHALPRALAVPCSPIIKAFDQ